jgi:CelD/BcsL family acetyltransferase involved in cellulose biosynthesis
MPTARRVRWNELSAADEAGWRALSVACFPLGNAFLTPTFATAAGRAYRRVKICFVEEKGELVAVLPFQFQSDFSALLGAAERVGEEMNDYFGLIGKGGTKYAPRDLLRLAGLNHFYFTHLGEEQRAFGLAGARADTGLRILLAEGSARYWDHLKEVDRKFVSDTERRERKAGETHGSLKFCFREAEPGRWIERLLAEKRRQYLETGKGDWLGQRARERLVRDLADTTHEECAGIVSSLHFGDTWAAIHFGLKSRRTLHYWLPVYNPALSAFAPGRLLLRQIILQADSLGLEVIDRGVGLSRAKSDFPSVQREYYAGVWRTPGFAAWIYGGLQSVKWRWQAWQNASGQSETKTKSGKPPILNI